MSVEINGKQVSLTELPEMVAKLTDRLSKAEKERDEAIAERDELRRVKSCEGCLNIQEGTLDYDSCSQCGRLTRDDYFITSDQSAEQGGVE